MNELPNLTDMSPHGVRAVVYDDKRKCRNDQKDYSNPPEESVNEMSYLTMGMCMGGFGKYKTDIEFVSCSVDEMGKQFFKLKIYKEGDNGKCKGSAMVVEKESGDFCNRSETFLDFYSGPLSWSCQQVTP
ncbi:hypothetical protein EON65_05670 [archaeon]|nr:MAG: hypothetical protein EON65_05670 [archaeon]